MFDSEILNGAKEGSIEIDCPKMKLVQLGYTNGTASTIEGAGCIRHGESGQLEYKMYSTSVESNKIFDNHFSQIKIGKFYPECIYYSLEGTDIAGANWKANRTLPDSSSGKGGHVIDGHCAQIETQEESASNQSGDYLFLIFRGELSLPWNKTIEQGSPLEKYGLEKGYRIGMVELDDGVSIYAYEVDKCVYIRCFSEKKKFDEEWASNLVSAFRFITGRGLDFVFLSFDDSEKVRKIIKSFNKHKVIPSIVSPLQTMGPDGRDYWLLFKAYFSALLSGDLTPEQRGWVNTLILAGDSRIEGKVLAASIAVEGMIGAKIRGAISYTPPHKLDELEKFILDGDWEEMAKKRFIGLLGSTRQARAKDVLHELAKSQKISKDLVVSWDSLRQPIAHAATFNWEDPQDESQRYLDKYFAVMSLIYKLIFLTIGYKGDYSEFSEEGFPRRKFDATL